MGIIEKGDYITCPVLKEGAHKVVMVHLNSITVEVEKGKRVEILKSWCEKVGRPFQVGDRVAVIGKIVCYDSLQDVFRVKFDCHGFDDYCWMKGQGLQLLEES